MDALLFLTIGWALIIGLSALSFCAYLSLTSTLPPKPPRQTLVMYALGWFGIGLGVLLLLLLLGLFVVRSTIG